MHLKKVSIGLPVYNGEAYLAETLESLLAQTYENFELIISDNASSDDTGKICQAYAARDPRIRYIRQAENIGAVPNFNHVFELADCKYFKWAAADDRCEETYLEKAVAILDENPEVVWCHSKSSHIDYAGRLLQDPASLEVSYREREAASPSKRFKAILLDDRGCLDSYGLIRSDAMRRTPLFLPFYGPEKVFMAELALMGPYREIPETLFFCRVASEGSGTLQSAVDQQSFADGQSHRLPPLTRLNFLLGYLRAIRRSAPGFSEAAKCWLALLRWIFQVSKWRRLAAEAVHGQGIGGRNTERLKQINEHADSALGRRS